MLMCFMQKRWSKLVRWGGLRQSIVCLESRVMRENAQLSESYSYPPPFLDTAGLALEGASEALVLALFQRNN